MTKNSIPIRFYLVLGAALLSLALIIALTARGVFGALKTANAVDESLLNSESPLINKDDLKKALDLFSSKSAPPIDAL